MKKLLTVTLLVVMVALSFATVANAATTKTLAADIYSVLSKYGMTSADKVKIERYLADNPVTEAEANQVLAQANAAAKVMSDAGVTNYKDLTADQKSEVKSIANKAADVVGVTLEFGTSSVKVLKDGKVIETITSNNGKLAYTGNNVNTVLVGSSIAIIALAAVVVANKRLANAR